MTTTLSDAWYKLPWAVRRLIVPAIVVALFVF
jgi:hypothetical protein